jgi:hypothetical protein
MAEFMTMKPSILKLSVDFDGQRRDSCMSSKSSKSTSAAEGMQFHMPIYTLT